MKKTFFYIAIFMFSSCVKDKDYKSHTETKLINTTKYKIAIKPYLSGSPVSEQEVILQPNETRIVYEGNPLGKAVGPCWGTLLQPYDSVLISYDDLRRSNHLKFSDTGTICDYCISFNANRNISNDANYLKTITKEEKEYMNGFFTYTFTEQDYLDAKD